LGVHWSLGFGAWDLKNEKADRLFSLRRLSEQARRW
jgi:hypothetical protein